MNIAKILEEHKKAFLEAKDELEASRLKKPDREFPVKAKQQTLSILKKRLTNLGNAKQEAVQKFNVRVETTQAHIVRLEKEIVDAQNLLGIKADDKKRTGVKRTGVKSKSRKKK